jgi:hypothetical protein
MYIYGKDIIGIRETSQGPKQIGKNPNIQGRVLSG